MDHQPCAIHARLLFFVISSVWIQCVVSNEVKVTTSGGTITGDLLPADVTAGGVAVEQYLGIPFATAKRFNAPVDYRSKYPGGSLVARRWGPACMQVAGNPSKTYGSEHCLVLNVWKPMSRDPDPRLPVMVFIYGGSNQFGEAEPYNMSALAAFHDVVCVTFNYRTGPIGWMAFQEDVDAGISTGNWGILDIQSALRWVQRESKAFGGDPSKVAIHGQSSGAVLAELQYVAPHSAKLFQGVISESGGLDAQSLKISLVSSAVAAVKAGCMTILSGVNRTCMETVPALSLTVSTYTGKWGPTIDSVTFPDEPERLLEQGLVHNATVVIGAQKNDSNLFLFRAFTKDGLDQPNDHPDGALRPLPPLEYKAMVTALTGPARLNDALRLYPLDKRDYVRNLHQLGSLQSDRAHCRNQRRVSLLDRTHPGRSFQYIFDYWYRSNPNCQAVPNFHLPYLGAAHQDEVTFVLGQPNFMNDGSCCGKWGLISDDCPRLPRCQACYDTARFNRSGYKAYFNDIEWEFSRKIGKLWTNVAATGDPNCRGRGICEKLWAPSKGAANIVFNATIPGGTKMERTPHDRPDICEFWNEVFVTFSEGDVTSVLV